jgi:protein gp37
VKPSEIIVREPFSGLFPIDPRVLDAVTESMTETGFHESSPVVLWSNAPDGKVLLDGHTRLKAASVAGIADVPTAGEDFADERAALEFAIRAQRDRRSLTRDELTRFAVAAIARLDARKPVGRPSKTPSPEGVSAGESAEKTAALVGVSRATVERVRTVLDSGDAETKAALTSGAVSVNGAYQKVREAKKHAEPAKTPAPIFTPKEWTAKPQQEREAVAAAAVEDSETKFNRTNDNVEWALWTWNPITGCLHDCAYCYARDIAERFYPQKFVPTIHPARFGASTRTPFPPSERIAAPFDQAAVKGGIGEKNVFTCSMADLFGKWVPSEWVEKVLDEIRSNPKWNYLLLTKFPQRLADFDFPDNAWVGTTVDTQARVAAAEKAFERFDAKVKWLSCEPMMERLTFKRLDLFDWVVIGGASKSTQTPEFKPPFEWACHLYTQAKAAGCSVYMKTNLLDRVREYPS